MHISFGQRRATSEWAMLLQDCRVQNKIGGYCDSCSAGAQLVKSMIEESGRAVGQGVLGYAGMCTRCLT